MTTTLPVHEGKIPFRGHEVWYRVVGEGESPGRLPLLVLHGGPGATHHYLEPLSALAQFGRRVIFYDQIGCGNSDRITDPDFYDVDLFVDELATVRRELGLDDVHILGQSWGGMLAMQYALTQPEGVASMIVADSPASMTHWVSEANRLRTELPPDVQAALTKHEAEGTTTDAAYAAAVDVFYRKHVCRVEPWPEPMIKTAEALAHDGFVYNVMNGPSEFHVIGKLVGWTIVDRLHEITIPTLLISGRYDEATPAIVDEIHQRIPGSEWIVFEESSHTPHLEEPAAFNAAVRGFMAGVELG